MTKQKKKKLEKLLATLLTEAHIAGSSTDIYANVNDIISEFGLDGDWIESLWKRIDKDDDSTWPEIGESILFSQKACPELTHFATWNEHYIARIAAHDGDRWRPDGLLGIDAPLEAES